MLNAPTQTPKIENKTHKENKENEKNIEKKKKELKKSYKELQKTYRQIEDIPNKSITSTELEEKITNNLNSLTKAIKAFDKVENIADSLKNNKNINQYKIRAEKLFQKIMEKIKSNFETAKNLSKSDSVDFISKKEKSKINSIIDTVLNDLRKMDQELSRMGILHDKIVKKIIKKTQNDLNKIKELANRSEKIEKISVLGRYRLSNEYLKKQNTTPEEFLSTVSNYIPVINKNEINQTTKDPGKFVDTVKKMQQKLTKEGYPTRIDGIIGPETYANFQNYIDDIENVG